MKMCQALGKAGHQVTLFGVRGEIRGDLFARYGVEPVFAVELVARPDIRFAGEAVFAARTARRVRSLPPPDLYYARSFASLALLDRSGVAMVYEVHDLPSTWVQAKAEERFTRRPHFVRLVSISDALRREYLERLPHLGADRVVTCRDGSDLPPADIEPASLGGRQGALAVGYTGHLYPGRGIEVIVELARQLEQLDFHVVGGEPADVDRWRAKVSAPNLCFHGHVAHAEVGRYLRAFDLVLAPYQRKIAVSGGRGDISRWLSPMKLFEYMAHGKAIVCSDLPVLREILGDGENALLVGPTDVDGWCAAVRRLAAEPDLRRRLGEGAHRDVRKRYTWSARAQLAVTDELLQQTTT
jgi:glycosyltransferase involved in cell wall biosynthesis